MITKCCVIDMHTRKLENKLNGDTSKDRFDDYIHQCQSISTCQTLWETYPVLENCINTKFRHYQSAMSLFFTHLAEDIEQIEQDLLGDTLARMTQFAASGDTHRQSKRVFVIHGYTTNKEKCRFVYKPRSISNEVIFQNMCHWYNDKISSHQLRTPRLIDKSDHGYCEFIDYQTCDSLSDLAYFYSSLGQLTAIMLVINGLDLHYENIIAHGKYPVMIDLECIMTPVIKGDGNQYPNVTQSLILPRQANIDKNQKGINLSAISDNVNQQSWRKVPTWQKSGTDEMHLTREDGNFITHGNTPCVTGQKAKAVDAFEEDFVNGFSTAYRLLLNHKNELLLNDSPLFELDSVETRYLFRSTSDYAILLFESYHPLLLMDQQKYNEHMDWLLEILPYRPNYQSVTQAEMADVMQGDIPYFSSQQKSQHVYNASGHPLELPIEKNGEEQCRFMLDILSEGHLDNQTRLIRLSFKAYRWNKIELADLSRTRFQSTLKTSESNSQLIRSLIDDAIMDDTFIAWPQMNYEEHQAFTGGLSGLSFYNGTIGVAFVLAQWDRYFQCHDSRDMVERIIKQSMALSQDNSALGFGLRGYAGMLYAAHHIAQCGYPEAETLVQHIIRCAGKTPIEHDEAFDVMSGVSHDITTLLHFADTYSIHDQVIHDSMAHLKDKCPDPACFAHNEDSFFDDGTPHAPNLGYAHGLSGVAVAFSRYAKRYQDKEAEAWVIKTMDLLDEHFYHEGGFWPDMRMMNDVSAQAEVTARPPAWCGGHAGIALFYLECYLHWPALKQRAQQGLERCVALIVKFSDDEKPLPNLCCGFYGDLDLLHLIDQRVNDLAFDGLKETIDKLHGISHETSLDTFFVGLFHGIPSYLYLNLRHQFPESMPSALYW